MQPALQGASGPAMPALRCTEALRDVRISRHAVARPAQRRPTLSGNIFAPPWPPSLGAMDAKRMPWGGSANLAQTDPNSGMAKSENLAAFAGDVAAQRELVREAPPAACEGRPIMRSLHLKSSGQSAGTVSDELLHALPSPGGSFLGAICMSGLGDGMLSLRGLGSSLSRLAVCSQPF